MGSRHAGVGPAFIDKDQVGGVHRSQLLLKRGALCLHAWAVLLLGMQGLLLAGDLVSLQGPSDRHHGTRDAEAIAQFCQGGIRLLPDQIEQTCFGRSIELAWGTRLWLGLHGPGLAFALEETDDAGETDSKQVGKLAEGMFAPFDGSDKAFPQIVGIDARGCTSSQVCLPWSIVSVCNVCVNRSRRR